MSLFSFDRPRLSRALPYNNRLWPGIIFFAALTGIGCWYGGWWAWQNHLFADHGQVIEARVLRKYLAESQGKHGPVYTPHLTYGYQVGNVVVNSDVAISRDTWDQVDGNGGIPIRYLPEDVADSRLANTAEDFKAMLKARLGLGGGLAAFVMGIVGTTYTNRRRMRVERLRTMGLTAAGHVKAVDTERSGKQRVTFLRFEFPDNTGRVIQGRSGPLTFWQQRLWRPGKAIAVFYDPVDSSVFTVNPSVVMDR
jgi:hypothetical protein